MPISRPEEVLNNVRSTAERSGAAEAETFFEFVRFVEVRYREGEVELLQQSAVTGLGLRVLRDQKMGFLYTTNLNRTVLDELVVRTIALASQASPRDRTGSRTSSSRRRRTSRSRIRTPTGSPLKI
jgi:predicted Zn-dependent protease